MIAKHPKSLYTLFSTEMWERFSFYSMQFLLVLYATAKLSEGGLGWSHQDAREIYGLYVLAVYLTPIIGGYFADKILGLQRSILLGATLMMLGHFMMAFNQVWTFYAALSLLALGNGFFKPSISSAVGLLYDVDDPKRDGGYTIFYMGINIGAFFAGIIGGWLQVSFGFDAAFTIAGVGMAIGLITFSIGKKKLPSKTATAQYRSQSKKKSSQPRLTSLESNKLTVVAILTLFSFLYFVAYWQIGATLVFYTEEFTDRTFAGWEIPSAWFLSLNALFIMLFAPFIGKVWEKFAAEKRELSTTFKISLGFLITAAAYGSLGFFSQGLQTGGVEKVGMWVVVLFYALYTLGELCIVPVMLSSVRLLAPEAYLSRVMALVFLAIGLGGYASSQVGSFYDTLGPYQMFMALSLLMFCTGAVMFLLEKKLTAMCSNLPTDESSLTQTIDELPAES